MAHGGLSAVADGNINLCEINGDLILIQAQGSVLPAVQAGGDVMLRAHSGSILDGIHELPVLANSDPLTPQQQLLVDQLNGLAPIGYTDASGDFAATPMLVSSTLVLDLGSAGSALQTQDKVIYMPNGSGDQQDPIGGLTGGATYYVIALGGGQISLALTAADAQHGNAITLSTDSNTAPDNTITLVGTANFDTDPNNDISTDSFQFPVSPGLYSYLYPQSNFLGLEPVQTTNEVLNVVGAHVTLIADGGGSIGNSQAPTAIDMTGGFAGLSDSEKIALSNATASDVYGRQYATYRYVGPDGADGSNLDQQNFGNMGNWEHITYFVTGASNASPISHSTSTNDYVLVEFNNGSYGLYQYKGTSGTLNLATQNYADTTHWTKIMADRSTDDSGTGALYQGMIVLDKTNLERVALQLRDDVNVQVGGSSLTATADGNLAIASPTDLSVDAIRAGGDVLLQVNGSLTDTYANGFAAIGAFGDLSISANGAVHGGGAHSGDPLRIALSTSSRLYVDASGSIDILQKSGNLTIDGTTKAISSLYVAKASTPQSVDIAVMDGNMTVERVDAGTGVNLIADSGSIIDAFDDDSGPIVNVASGDLYLYASQNIGSSGNFFDVQVSGDFSGYVGNDAFINSPDTLNITTFTSAGGDVTMTVGGTTNVGLISAHQGTVKITSEDDIVDRYNDAAADIESNSVVLESLAGAIGSMANWFDIDTSYTSPGTVNALALVTVFLIETQGDMRIDKVRSQTSNVWLKSLTGSLLDANGLLENNVTGIDVNLEALGGGSIGTPGDALEIDSSNPSKGVLNAHAEDSINVTETDGMLYIGTVTADAGNVILSVRDNPGSGDDFVMEVGAAISAPTTTLGGGDVLIQAGDNVHLYAGSSIDSGRHLVIHSGYGDSGNAGPRRTPR